MRRATALGLCATLAWTLVAGVTFLGPVPLLYPAEMAIYDTHLRASPPRPPDPRVVIVALDEGTPAQLPGLENAFYPLPRRYHARVVENLRRAGARVIAFDLMFSRPTRDDDDPALALSDAWAASLHVLSFYLERSQTEAYIGTATDIASLRG